MAQTKITGEKLYQLLDSWEQVAPESSFGGMSLADFKAATQPSIDQRQNASDAVLARRAAIARRETADETTRALMKRVVSSVIGDPAHGSNSAIYRAMGYRTDAERASGLTRKDQTAQIEPAEGLALAEAA
jgi:hypothetical protein